MIAIKCHDIEKTLCRAFLLSWRKLHSERVQLLPFEWIQPVKALAATNRLLFMHY